MVSSQREAEESPWSRSERVEIRRDATHQRARSTPIARWLLLSHRRLRDKRTSRPWRWMAPAIALLACVLQTAAHAETTGPTYWLYPTEPARKQTYWTAIRFGPPQSPYYASPQDACSGDEAQTKVHTDNWPLFGNYTWSGYGYCSAQCLAAGGCDRAGSTVAYWPYGTYFNAGAWGWGPDVCQPGYQQTNGCYRACPLGYEIVSNMCVQPGGGPNVDIEAQACPATAKPVGISTGDKRLTETDYLGLASPLAFVRYYNALPIRDSSPLAPRWLHSYSGWVTEQAGAMAGAYIFRPNGGMRWARNTGAAIVSGRQQWAVDRGFNERLFKLYDASNKAAGWILIDLDGTVETYSSGGRILSIMKVDGAALRMDYATGTRAGGMYMYAPELTTVAPIPYGLLTRVTDSLGRVLRLDYVAPSRLAKLTTPANQEILYGYNAAGNLDSVTYPDGHTRRYVYNEPELTGGVNLPYAITGLIDESGARLGSYAYDSVGRVVQSQWWADAARTRAADPSAFSYSTTATTVTDGLGAARTYNFALVNGRRVLMSQSQPPGAGCGPSSAFMTYDANANVSSRTDFNGVKTCYAYDLSRNLETRRVEGVATSADCATALSSPPAGARVISTQWHPDWRFETRIAEPNKITTLTYNGQGASCAPSTVLVDGKPPAVLCAKSEQATTDATGTLGFGAGLTGTARTWSYTYATYGRVLTATDPNGKTTTTTYYPDDDPDLGRRGNVASITNAATHVTRITAYNLHGQPTQIVDPNGLITDLTYDARMRLKSRKVGNELTGFTYDPRGLLTTVTLPDGASLTYTYDAAHRLIAIADQQNNRIDYTLDAMGNRVSERASDSGGTLVKNIQRTIDALNRVKQVTGAQ